MSSGQTRGSGAVMATSMSTLAIRGSALKSGAGQFEPTTTSAPIVVRGKGQVTAPAISPRPEKVEDKEQDKDEGKAKEQGKEMR